MLGRLLAATASVGLFGCTMAVPEPPTTPPTAAPAVATAEVAIGIVLSLTGLNMLGVPPRTVGIIGAGLLLLGPLVWGYLRQKRGIPPFDNNAAAWRIPDPDEAPGD